MLFTHFGLSGPVILNLSNLVGQQLLAGKSVLLLIDVVPDLDPGQLNLGLNDLFRTKSNRLVKNVLDEFVPNALIPHLLSRAEIDEKKFAHSVTREERLKLASAAKNLCIEVDKLLGKDKSVVTSGGVSLEEIDMKTMRSRLVNNLFLVGDMLDIDRPSGGYSLQLCWTTGWVAGSHAGDKKKSSG
jgi:predicted Rossmann fold flavoprotein